MYAHCRDFANPARARSAGPGPGGAGNAAGRGVPRPGPGQNPGGAGDQATLTAILTRWNRLPVMCAWMRPFR